MQRPAALLLVCVLAACSSGDNNDKSAAPGSSTTTTNPAPPTPGTKWETVEPAAVGLDPTKLEWANPHGFFYVDVKGENGAIEHWSFQTYALITLRRAGNGREIFLENIGKEVWVRGCLARNGREHYAAAGSLKFASDGILRQMGQLQD